MQMDEVKEAIKKAKKSIGNINDQEEFGKVQGLGRKKRMLQVLSNLAERVVQLEGSGVMPEKKKHVEECETNDTPKRWCTCGVGDFNAAIDEMILLQVKNGISKKDIDICLHDAHYLWLEKKTTHTNILDHYNEAIFQLINRTRE